jgi:hypothetical protein
MMFELREAGRRGKKYIGREWAGKSPISYKSVHRCVTNVFFRAARNDAAAQEKA